MATRYLKVGGILCTILLLGAVASWKLARVHNYQLLGRLVAEADTRDSVVALTFDDGPVANIADFVIDTLRAHRVQATFFVTGREIAAAPAAAARLVSAGHELGNHSYLHHRMLFMNPGRIRDEIERTDSLIRTAGSTGTIYFRPPYGLKLIGLPWFLAHTGRTTVMWSIEPDSYLDVAGSPDRIVAHVLDRVRPGSIILLHVWYQSRRTSRAAIGPLIDSLHARGYRVTTVRELLAARQR